MASEGFIVRAAGLADYEQVCALLAAVDELHRSNLPWLFRTPEAEPRSRAFFERLLNAEDSTVLVAVADKRLLGVATALLRSAPEFAVFVAQRWGVLDNIAVAEAWRRRGVGTALTRAAEGWARSRGAKWIELGVYEFNAEARSFYRALGYEPVSTKLRKPFDADG